MTRTQELKQPIRAFMREHYTDERLAQLLAHAQEGKLAYYSCCCFIGVATANHALRLKDVRVHHNEHYERAQLLSGSRDAEYAFLLIGHTDAQRRRLLIPMIRAEMKRRDTLRAIEAQMILIGLSSEQQLVGGRAFCENLPRPPLSGRCA